MFQDLINAIKGTRKLTLNHWRYRLLHWSFGIDAQDAQDGKHGGLPKFLYTHYCPLFHLTNILVLVAPVILCVRILYHLFSFLSVPIEYICSGANFVIDSYKSSIKARPGKSAKQKELEFIYDRINHKLQQYNYDFDCVTADFIVSCCHVEYHTDDEVREIAKKYLAKAKVQHLKKLEAEKRRAAQMVFWINWSRTILKGIYALIALLGLYATVVYIVPFLLWLLICLFYVDWWNILYLALSVIVYLACCAIPASIFIYIATKLENSDDIIRRSIIGFLREVFGGIGSFFNECCDFIAIIYENNCPPIELVSGSDEEALAKLDE